MAWQYTPYTLPLLLAVLLNTGLACYTWQRSSVFGGRTFFALAISLVVWALCEGISHVRIDLEGKVFWGVVAYLGIVPVPALWLLITLQYTGRGAAWRWTYALLALEPIAVLVLVFTKDYHALWSVEELVWRDGYAYLQPHFAALFWVHVAYSYALIAWGSIVLAREFFLASGLYRRQIAALFISVCIPWFANIAGIFGLSAIPPSLAFSATGLIIGWSIFRLQVLDLVPVASATLVERLQDGVVALDVQDRLVFVNPAAAKVLEGRPVIGQTLEHALPVLAELVGEWDPRARVQAEWVSDAADGRRFYQLQQSPLYGWQQMWAGRLLVLHDISERKREELELVQTTAAAESANRAKSEFLANMSHELRTPLNAVLGYAQVLRDSPHLPADCRGSVQTMERSADHLLQTIEAILTLARVEAGQQVLQTVDFALGELVATLEAVFGARCRQKGLAWEVEELVGGMRARGDADKLHQVLANLLDNALKFTAAGRVWLKVEQRATSRCYFEVGDTGKGIASERQQAIFEPFQQEQVDFSEGGTGLGLALAQRYVELLGGVLQLQSERGGGSRFSFELPLELAVGDEEWKPQIRRTLEPSLAPAVELDLSQLQVPAVLLQTLDAAVKAHSITQLNRSLENLEAAGGDAEDLAGFLRPLARRYDMAKIHRALQKLNTT